MSLTLKECDCLVIGGGPAGASTAAILSEKGHSVLLVEKEGHSRYHVGESLMPFCWYSFDRLGVLDEVKSRGFPQKYSVQFVRQDGMMSQPFYFFQHMDHDSSTTWQVNRSEFDQLLRDKAESNGATVLYNTRAEQLIEEDDEIKGAIIEEADGSKVEVRARMTVDASGRDTFSQVRHSWRKRDPYLNKIALWTYYKGAKRDSGYDEGATTVAYLPDRGWFWYIPLKDDIVSVGIVGEKDYLFRNSREPAEIYAEEIQNNEWIKEHLADAEQFGEYWVTGEYSYRSRHCSRNGLLLVGDAFAFLDPVFSSGVFLALASGIMGGDAVDKALNNDNTDAAQFDEYSSRLCHGVENMRRLVYAFYNPDFSFGKLIKNHPELRGDLTDCLIGDLFDKEYEELFTAIAEDTPLPEKLPHGGPLTPASH